jgi:hypothetical protein
MSVNSYLERLANNGVIRDYEKENIARSLLVLKERLDLHFTGTPSNGGSISNHFAFGSFTRGTILPRSMDPHSDIDYMIVFEDSDCRPQAYLDRLRRFVERFYRTSEITQSHPTIILSLNHIRFELVPAVDTFWIGKQIPAKGSGYTEWMSTAPNDFNNELTADNKRNDNLTKPLIRLMKYWNACNQYPFESFELEKKVVAHWTILISLFGGNLWERFAAFMNEQSVWWADTKFQGEAVERAQAIIAKVEELESQNMPEQAERALCRLLPEIG